VTRAAGAVGRAVGAALLATSVVLASCDTSTVPGAAGSAGSAASGHAGTAGHPTAETPGNAGTGSFPGVVPFDPIWTKTTPPDWVPYPIPDTPCDGCTYMNPDGVDRLVDSVRAQRADGRWSVFGSLQGGGEAHKAAWAIDLLHRAAYALDDGCSLRAPSDTYCGAAAPSVDSDFAVYGVSTSSRQAVLIRAMPTGETKLAWRTSKTLDKNGLPTSSSLLATGMAYPFAFWVEAGIYRLDLRDGTVVHHPDCDVIEAVTVARNGLACCDGYGQGAVLIDLDHDHVERYPAGFLDPNRIGIHSYLSKDGTELVWAEHPAGGRENDSYRIVYRNLVSGEERVLVQNDDPTVKRNDYPVVERGVVFWERQMVTNDPNGMWWMTGMWKVGDEEPTFWDRALVQFRPTPYGLVAVGFPGNEIINPIPNLLFPYPDGYRPLTMPPPDEQP
jgi:hypothetical protein